MSLVSLTPWPTVFLRSNNFLNIKFDKKKDIQRSFEICTYVNINRWSTCDGARNIVNNQQKLTVVIVCLFIPIINKFSLNLLAIYHECRSLIGYFIHCLFCYRMPVAVVFDNAVVIA